MTAAEHAAAQLDATIEAIEAHPGGPRTHPAPKGILVWHGAHLTEAATCSLPLLRAMIDDEVLSHWGVTFA